MSNQSEVWLRLIQVIGSIEGEVGKLMQAKHGLGLSEYRALSILARSPDGELRMQELALHLSLNQSSISRLVERLERSGLTVRDLCPDDKRGVYTVLTEKGRHLLREAQLSYESCLNIAIKMHRLSDIVTINLSSPT